MNDFTIEREQHGHHGSFFIERDGAKLAEMTYSATPGGRRIIIDHTEVSEALKGTGAGKQLVKAAVEWARAERISILPLCPFAKAQFDRTPEYRDVLWVE